MGASLPALATVDITEPSPAAAADAAIVRDWPAGLSPPFAPFGWRDKLRWSGILAGTAWTALAIVIIGLLGLEVLYLGSDTWGSLRDFIVAILWGLGLHSGAGVVTTAAVNRTSKLPGAPD